MNLVELKTKVAEIEETKKDQVVDFKDTRVIHDGTNMRLSSDSSEGFPLTKTATRQLAHKVGMPIRYLSYLQESDDMIAHTLLEDNLNYLITKKSKEDQPTLLRIASNRIRAFLSPKYMVLDNAEILKRMFSILDDSFEYEGHIDDDFMHITLVSNQLQAEIQKGDVVKAGVVISNSETGLGRLNMMPRIYRLVCTNGLVRGFNKDLMFSQVHRGFNNFEDYWPSISTTTSQLLTSFPSEAERLAELAIRNFQNMENTLHNIGKEFKLDKKQLANLQTAYQVEPMDNHWGLVNAFTRAAQNEKDFTSRLEMERIGGEVSEMSVEKLSRFDFTE